MQSNLHWLDQEDAQGETQRAQAGGEAWRNEERHRCPYAHESNYMIDWDGARVKRSGMTNYWQRRTTEAIHMKLSEKTINLDGGLQLSTVCPSGPEPTLTNPCVVHSPSPIIILTVIIFIIYS